MAHHSVPDDSTPSTTAGDPAESGTAPLSVSTTPPTTAPASSAAPDEPVGVKEEDTTPAQPRKPSDPFPYTSDAFWEWFRTCSRTDRIFAPFVAFCGGGDGPAQTGPYKGQRFFQPHGEYVSVAALFIPLSMVPMGFGAFAFFFLAHETGVQPSSAAFTRWVSDAWWAGVYLWCGGLGVVSSFFFAAGALSLVWMAGYPLAHLAFDGLNLFPKRVQLTLLGTAAVALTRSLLLTTFVTVTVPFFRVAYALPALAVALDWWLEALLTRVARRSAGSAGERERERGGDGEGEGTGGKGGGVSAS
ncbi:hypothetical protein JCM6882_002989 [Rhodosporidiobolus microsporus]